MSYQENKVYLPNGGFPSNSEYSSNRNDGYSSFGGYSLNGASNFGPISTYADSQQAASMGSASLEIPQKYDSEETVLVSSFFLCAVHKKLQGVVRLGT